MVPPHQGTHLSILATANKKPPPTPRPHPGNSPPLQERDGGATSLVFPTPVRAGQLSRCLEGFHPADSDIKRYWDPQLCLCSHTSRTGLPIATDWLDNWGVKALLFQPYHKVSVGRPVVNKPEPVHRHIWNPWLWAVLCSSWFYGAWSQQWVSHITLLELYPTVLAVQIWGSRLANERIIFHTNNQVLVPIINQQSSKDRVWELVITCLRFNISFQAQHIAGKANIPPVMSTSQCLPGKSPFGIKTARSSFPTSSLASLTNTLATLVVLALATASQECYRRGHDLYVQFAQKYSISEQFPVPVSSLALFILGQPVI